MFKMLAITSFCQLQESSSVARDLSGTNKKSGATFISAPLGSWATRTRTMNDRTRICSVTITPLPNLNSDAKILLFS